MSLLPIALVVAALTLAATPAATQAPPAPTEACGDCVDGDGDGLADDEDPDCCAETGLLGLERLRLRSGTGRLDVEAVYAPATPPFFDPLRQDVSLTVSAGSGALLCAPMRAGGWRRPRSLAYRFVIRAGTILRATFRVARDSSVRFAARAARVAPPAPDTTTVRVTLRVGTACAQADARVRAQGPDLLFP